MAFGTLRGSLVVNATSITDPFNAAGSVAVSVGDLIYGVIGEQTGNTTTAVTDNLGNSYTATQAGTATTGTVISGRAFYSRVTVAGTLTQVRFDTTASTNNAAAVAAVFEGPFLATPIDRNPTNITSDVSSPFACPATTALTIADELVVAWSVCSGNITLSATAPNLTTAALRQNTASVLSTTIGYQRVASTASVTPNFTGTNPTVQILGTTSFFADVTQFEWMKDQSFPSTPTKTRKAAAVVLIASGLMAPPAVVPTPPATAVPFTQTDTSIVFPRYTLYQSATDPIVVDATPENVTVDKWLREFESPIRASIRPRDLTVFVPYVAATDTTRFVQTESTLIISGATLYQSIADPIVVDTAPEQVTVDKWFKSFENPYWQRPVLSGRIALAQVTEVPAALDTSLPPGRVTRTVCYQSVADPIVVTAAENVTVDKWLRQFDVPFRLRHPTQQDYGQPLTVAVVPEDITADKWLRQFDIPSRLRWHAPQDYGQPLTVSVAPENVTADKWFVSFEQIIRARCLLAAQQQAYVNPATTPAPPPPAPPLDGWSYEWSGPVRLNVLAVANQLEAAAPVIPQPNPDPPAPTGVYTVSGQYVIDQFTNNTVVYDYGGGVSHRTN